MLPSQSVFSRKGLKDEGPKDTRIDALSEREKQLHRYGEVLTVCGILILIVALLILNSATGENAFSNKYIHIPDALAPYLTLPETPSHFNALGGYYPYGSVILGPFIILTAAVAIFRKRLLLGWGMLGICLFPWQLFSISIMGLYLGGFLLLVHKLFGAARQKNYKNGAIFAALLLTHMGIVELPADVWKPNEERALGLSFKSASKPNSERFSFEQISVPAELEDAKAYVLAQELFFAGENSRLANVISQIPLAEILDGSLEMRRVSYMRHYLAKADLLNKPIGWLEAHYLNLQYGVAAFLGLIAALSILGGESFEYLSGKLLTRGHRIKKLERGLQRATSDAKAIPTTESRINTALHRIKFRATFVSVLMVVSVACSLLLVLLAAWWSQSSGNDEFSNIHILHSFLRDLQARGASIDYNDNPFAGHVGLSLLKWTSIFAILLSVLFIFLKNRRALRLVLVSAASIIGGGLIAIPAYFILRRSPDPIYKWASFLVLFLGIGASIVNHFGMLHAGKIEITPTEIQAAIAKANNNSIAQGSARLEQDTGYRYTLAQLAYLTGDIEATAENVHWIYENTIPTSDLAQRRLATMRYWLVANGDDPNGPGKDEYYVWLFGLANQLANWAYGLAATLMSLALLLSIFAGVLFMRVKRMKGIVADMSESVLAQKMVWRQV